MDMVCCRARLGVLMLLAFSFGAIRAGSGCDPLPKGVLGWWPGDGTPADLTAAANHGQLVNGATFAPGLVGQAFSLDGTNDRVDVPDAPSLRPQHFTLAAWVRLDDNVEWACIVCKQFGAGSADSYSLWVNFGILQGGMYGFAEAVASVPLPVGRWVHTAVSWDGAIIRLYQNGQMVAAAAGPASPVPYDSNQVIIGAEDNGTNAYAGFFDGTIDEVQIFGRALSACEIRALYRALPQGSCKGDTDADLVPDFADNCPKLPNAGQQDTDADGTGDVCDCAPADPGVFAQPGDSDQLVFLSHDMLDWCLDPTFNGPSTVYDILRGDLDQLPVSVASPECRSGCLAPLLGLVGWWTGDGNPTDLAAGNNGTLQNGATYGAGLVRQSFSLDGVNDRVLTGNLSLGNTFSVAAWVNSDAVSQGAYRRIVENGFSNAFYLGTDALGTGYKLIVKTPAAPYGTVNGGKVTPGEWQLVVGTYDGATGRLYVDGKLVSSGAFPAPGAVNLPVSIGAFTGGGNAWKGRIDEVQIYNRMLSADEVRALYEAGSAGGCKSSLGGVDAEWTAPGAADGDVPEPSAGFWYLFRGRNSCGQGPYGYATDGTESTSQICD